MRGEDAVLSLPDALLKSLPFLVARLESVMVRPLAAQECCRVDAPAPAVRSIAGAGLPSGTLAIFTVVETSYYVSTSLREAAAVCAVTTPLAALAETILRR